MCNETSELNRQNQIILLADNGHHIIIKYFDILSHRLSDNACLNIYMTQYGFSLKQISIYFASNMNTFSNSSRRTFFSTHPNCRKI